MSVAACGGGFIIWHCSLYPVLPLPQRQAVMCTKCWCRRRLSFAICSDEEDNNRQHFDIFNQIYRQSSNIWRRLKVCYHI